MLDIQKRLSNLFYAILSLPSTALGFALSVQIAALSWLLSNKYGLAIDEIGLVWAAGPIAGIFGQVIFGIVSDRVWFWGGRRRPFILIGGFLAALSLLALPNLEIISAALGMDGILGVAIIVALALDLSINVGFNPTRTIIADVTEEGVERTKGYTYMQTISGTFGMLAYLIGAWLDNYWLIYIGAGLVLLFTLIPPFFITEPRDFEDETPVDSHPFRDGLIAIRPLWGFLIYAFYRIPVRLFKIEVSNYYVEYSCAGLTLLLVALTLFQSEENKSITEASRIGFQKILAAHSFTWIGVQTMFIYMYAFLEFRFTELDGDGVGTVINYAFLVLNGVAAVLPAFVLEPITRNIGRVRTHFICILIMTIGYLGLWKFATTPLLIYSCMAVVGIGWAATISLVFAIMTQKADAKQMGLYMGLFNLSVVLPQLVASLGIGEFLSQTNDKSLTFLICAVCLGISALAWSLVKENEEKVPAPVGGGGAH
ncbi:MAG: MFS transporter [Bacteroidota bacterium]